MDVTVVTSGGTSATSSADQFTYLPSVTGISTDSGAVGGGTVVTITGSGFTERPDRDVRVGRRDQRQLQRDDAAITATAPAGAVGRVDVTVTTSSETSATSSADQFTYLPAVTGVESGHGTGRQRHDCHDLGSGLRQRVDRGLRIGYRDQCFLQFVDAAATATAAGRSGRRGCDRDHLRRNLRHVLRRPVHLRAGRDGRQSDVGPGGRRDQRHDQRIGLQCHVERGIRIHCGDERR